MKRFLLPALAIALVLFHFGGYWSATWWSKWTFLSFVFCLTISAHAASRTSWWYFPVMTWVLLTSVAASFQIARLPVAGLLPSDVAGALSKNALLTLFTTVAAVWTFSTSGNTLWRHTQPALIAVWAMGTLAYILIPNLPDNGWQFGNPSEGASLLACLLPFMWEECGDTFFALIAWMLTSYAIYRTHTTIAVGVLAVVTAVYWLRGSKRALLPLLVGPAFLIQQHISGKPMFDTNGRYPIWQMAYTWARDHDLLLFGVGAGSVQTIVPILQVQTATRLPDFFVWLHSDWLQIVFEYGWIGLACSLIALAMLLYTSWYRPALISSLLGFVALGFFGYPLRMPIHFFCLLTVCCKIESNLWVPVGIHSLLKGLGKHDSVPDEELLRAQLRSYSQSLGPSRSQKPSC